MLKAAGIFLIFAAGAGLGFHKSLELTTRERNLSAFLQISIYLKGVIRCGNASLPEAFAQAAARFGGMYGKFLLEIYERMCSSRGESFGEIFRDCAQEQLSGTGFSQREKSLIFSFGERLGCLDREMQLNQLTFFEKELEEELVLLRRELPERKKLCRSLGILGGLLLGVLLW